MFELFSTCFSLQKLFYELLHSIAINRVIRFYYTYVVYIFNFPFVKISSDSRLVYEYQSVSSREFVLLFISMNSNCSKLCKFATMNQVAKYNGGQCMHLKYSGFVSECVITMYLVSEFLTVIITFYDIILINRLLTCFSRLAMPS